MEHFSNGDKTRFKWIKHECMHEKSNNWGKNEIEQCLVTNAIKNDDDKA